MTSVYLMGISAALITMAQHRMDARIGLAFFFFSWAVVFFLIGR